jgi:coproporphyrinogen III oxidase-like Fe-S oxidoreductase
MRSQLFSVYVHWPYCATKCSYCAFNKYLIPKSGMQHEMIEECLVSDLSYDLERLSCRHDRILNSVYFGGGTPSLARPVMISKILKCLKDFLKSDTEVTLEMNPNSFINFDTLKAFKDAGVNRLSIGFQSLRNQTLKEFNRDHTVENSLKSLQDAQSIFDNISLDFIYCRNDQSINDWKIELLDILQLKVPHLTLYQLMIERGTDFFKKGIQIPNNDICAEMYENTIKVIHPPLRIDVCR